VSVLVIDPTIALKWVITEAGTEAALSLRRQAKLIAPELLLADCAAVLCKKVATGELMKDEALLAGRLLQGSGVEFVPTRVLLETAMLITLDLDHSAHDCFYVALAAARSCHLVTADAQLVCKVAEAAHGAWSDRVIPLQEAIRQAWTGGPH
jgi:predicted nucleic acid-binding protein